MAKQWVEARKQIAIDWNGVLDTYTGWRGASYTYPPRDGIAEFLQSLQSYGYDIVIMTAADPDIVRKWLDDYGLSHYVKEVTDHKVPALVYLDDRAVQFTGDFDQALERIVSFKTFWERPDAHEGGKL
jgi:hypothetical protein